VLTRARAIRVLIGMGRRTPLSRLLAARVDLSHGAKELIPGKGVGESLYGGSCPSKDSGKDILSGFATMVKKGSLQKGKMKNQGSKFGTQRAGNVSLG